MYKKKKQRQKMGKDQKQASHRKGKEKKDLLNKLNNQRNTEQIKPTEVFLNLSFRQQFKSLITLGVGDDVQKQKVLHMSDGRTNFRKKFGNIL